MSGGVVVSSSTVSPSQCIIAARLFEITSIKRGEERDLLASQLAQCREDKWAALELAETRPGPPPADSVSVAPLAVSGGIGLAIGLILGLILR